MIRFATRPATLLAIAGTLLFGTATPAAAQYFGRNKVQYERFDFRIMRTSHFDMYFYPAESLKVHDAGRLAERWYTRLSDNFRHNFDRKSLVFYADQPDFQQTNVIGESLTEGTGGVTEGLRTRVAMPWTGHYAEDDHVLGHELVHVFQYSTAESGPGGLARLNTLPLWLIEGMAEYFSLGRDNSLTAMWLRDAAERDRLPTIHQLNTDSRFFPYRYGQALWAYVGGRWGDRAVVDVYRASLRLGFEEGIRRVLGVSTDSLSKDWIAATRRAYVPVLEGRTRPRQAGDPVLQGDRKSGDMNLAPTVSPDGRLVAFYARRGLFEVELFVADAQTGRVIRKLASPTSDAHFDAISFISAAGSWSATGDKFAFVAQAEGDHEIAILDVRTADIERRIRVPGVGAISHIAWSPNGQTMAFSGSAGGISDIYLLDLAAGTVRQLTNDRHSDLQPAWSPDGQTIVFSSDRGPTTDFATMTFSPLQLATLDVASGRVSVFSPFARGKHINPQFAPDGRTLFFISDQDGFSDIYRLELGSGAVSRVTRLSTGVSGITNVSPALTVAPTTGRMLFSVFEDQGYAVYALDSTRTRGEPVVLGANVASASILPPGDVPGRATVTSYLRDPLTGLASGQDFTITPYRSSFALDAIGQPAIGVSAGGPFGSSVGGGVSFLFGDQLSDRQIGVGIEANGQIQDIGAQVIYQNLRNRWNWGASVQHTPFVYGGYTYTQQPNGEITQDLVIDRIYVDQAALNTAYPFSTTRRVEISAAQTRLGYNRQIQRFDLFNRPIDQVDGETPPAAYYSTASAALVGDNSYSAFTNPIQGTRYRFEISPTLGTFRYTSGLADYRKYQYVRPLTFAARGLHYGRYGRDSDNGALYPLFLGEEQILRGYGYGSFDPAGEECAISRAAAQRGGCPARDRLFGSRIALLSAEIRIPVFGVPEYGLFNVPFLPLTVSPFVDVAEVWSGLPGQSFSTSTNVGIYQPGSIVASAGISARVNVLGYAILEVYAAHPFQRPGGRPWVYGVQLAPGW